MMLDFCPYYWFDEDHKPYKVHDTFHWAFLMEHSDRTVKRDYITKDLVISTVFLAMDYRFCSAGEPVLWETMVFDKGKSIYMDRYTSYDEALKNHKILAQSAYTAYIMPYVKNLAFCAIVLGALALSSLQMVINLL